MSTRCTICSHPKLADIEAMLAQQLPCRQVGQKYGLTTSAVWRHWKLHALKRIEKKASKRAEQATAAAIASRDARIAAKDERWRRLQSAVVAATDEDVPKMVPVAAEVRLLEESAAKDLGQWIPEGESAARPASAQVLIIMPDMVAAGAVPRIATEAPAITLDADPSGVYRALPAPGSEPEE